MSQRKGITKRLATPDTNEIDRDPVTAGVYALGSTSNDSNRIK